MISPISGVLSPPHFFRDVEFTCQGEAAPTHGLRAMSIDAIKSHRRSSSSLASTCFNIEAPISPDRYVEIGSCADEMGRSDG